jgi:nicotinamide-nucleotide adenylyltransferase
MVEANAQSDAVLHAIFPGRFQPPTNAHIQRIQTILTDYPTLQLTIVVGDVGELNKDNFLTPNERVEMFEHIIHTRAWNRVKVTIVRGAPAHEWIMLLRAAVPHCTMVFSDNPFVTEPLAMAGFTVATFIRDRLDSSGVRGQPIEHWQQNVPEEVYNYIVRHQLHLRLLNLPTTGKYPFLDRTDAE